MNVIGEVMSLDHAIAAIQAFQGMSLTTSLASIEKELLGSGVNEVEAFCSERGINAEFISSALDIKKVAGQINVIIHAAGIIRSLPGLLREDELVESLSLGAGNTGRKFDLETNIRVAEFKFIDWQGGAETIRQNSIFKDFFELAEYETSKEKYLYVVDTRHPIKFFTSRRSIASVLSRQPQLMVRLKEKYGGSVKTVNDYFEQNKNKVHICDVSSHIGRGVR
jgi:hypothetical protein